MQHQLRQRQPNPHSQLPDIGRHGRQHRLVPRRNQTNDLQKLQSHSGMLRLVGPLRHLLLGHGVGLQRGLQQEWGPTHDLVRSNRHLPLHRWIDIDRDSLEAKFFNSLGDTLTK